MTPGRQPSVVMLAFSGAACVAATLDSLAAQTSALHELVVVGRWIHRRPHRDCSSSFIEAMVIEQREQGMAVALNTGLSATSSSHVAFLDQDDLW